MRRQIQWLLDQLFPAKCAVCGGTAPAGICPECLDKLPRTPEEICPHCGSRHTYLRRGNEFLIKEIGVV